MSNTPLELTAPPARRIKDAYMEYVLENGSKPASVFRMAKSIGIKEEEFYDHYTSFEAVEKDIWKDIFDNTRAKMEEDPSYENYSAREKLLSFYYTWVEVLKINRSFVNFSINQIKRPELGAPVLRDFKKEFDHYTKKLVQEGIDQNEIEDRVFISDKYADGLWFQLLFVLNFWLKDTSKGFEKSDVAIEKAVNLSFDMMAKGPLDSMIDFARFMFQNR
jgi:hypothetical protein